MGKTKCIQEPEFYVATDYKVTTCKGEDKIQTKLRETRNAYKIFERNLVGK
jgi:hypothetical protein